MTTAWWPSTSSTPARTVTAGGTAVASGTFNSDRTEKRVMFTSKVARYVRFVAVGEINGRAWASVAELDMIGVAQ